MHDSIHNFHEMEEFFFSLVSINKLCFKTMVAFETGVCDAHLNPVFVRKIDDCFLDYIAKCKSFFSQKQLPWVIVIPEYAQIYSEQEKILSKDYELKGIGVGMMLQPIPLSFDFPKSALTFKEMNDDLATWSIPLLHAFESTSEITSAYKQRHQEALEKSSQLYHFSGFLKGKVVVSMTLTVQGQQARIDDVATMPNFQKQGFATSLIIYSLSQALNLNVTTCFLEASDVGLTIYRRIGFQPIFMNHYYTLPI